MAGSNNLFCNINSAAVASSNPINGSLRNSRPSGKGHIRSIHSLDICTQSHADSFSGESLVRKAKRA